MKNFPTRVNLDEKTRAHLGQVLDVTLGTTLDLASQVKQAHCTIRGPVFVARHELFDDLADHLRGWSDDIAERAATLGMYPNGTVRMASKSSQLTDWDTDLVNGDAVVKALADRYGRYCSMMREMVGEADKSKDPATEDLFTEILRAAEMDLWFLESQLER